MKIRRDWNCRERAITLNSLHDRTGWTSVEFCDKTRQQEGKVRNVEDRGKRVTGNGDSFSMRAEVDRCVPNFTKDYPIRANEGYIEIILSDPKCRKSICYGNVPSLYMLKG